jgi:hypothetical protein
MVATVVVFAEVTSGSNKVIRAIRYKAFGDPSVLELAEVAAPAVDETTALVRVVAASHAEMEAYRKVAAGSAGRVVLWPQE